MKILKMLGLLIVISVFVISMGGCAATLPPPKLAQPESSGIAIDISLKPPIAFYNTNPSQVYFVRINEEDGLFQQSIIRSNYVKDSRVYLLNAKPGTYVAVGAFYQLYVNTGKSNYTTYFSKDLVEKTKVVIGESDFKFMGSYIVSMGLGLDGADEVQRHYQNIISPGLNNNGILSLMSGDYHYRGSIVSQNNDDKNHNQFFENAKKDLANSGWEDRIK